MRPVQAALGLHVTDRDVERWDRSAAEYLTLKELCHRTRTKGDQSSSTNL